MSRNRIGSVFNDRQIETKRQLFECLRQSRNYTATNILDKLSRRGADRKPVVQGPMGGSARRRRELEDQIVRIVASRGEKSPLRGTEIELFSDTRIFIKSRSQSSRSAGAQRKKPPARSCTGWTFIRNAWGSRGRFRNQKKDCFLLAEDLLRGAVKSERNPR